MGGLDRDRLEELAIRVEDKGAIVALHWRGSPNESEAETWASELASAAEWKGLVPHLGRMVLEIRPDVAIDKGRAVASLLEGRDLRRRSTRATIAPMSTRSGRSPTCAKPVGSSR